MTSRKSKRRQRRRATASSVETDKARRARLKEEQDRRTQQRAQSGALVVYPFKEWCVLRGISVMTGRRLIAAGKVRITHLSERRIGIRADHDREYLDGCERGPAAAQNIDHLESGAI
jgi:hypothetical protein